MTGLSIDQVAQSRAQHGANFLTPPERVPRWKEFLFKCEDPAICILILADTISSGMGDVVSLDQGESLAALKNSGANQGGTFAFNVRQSRGANTPFFRWKSDNNYQVAREK